MSSGALPADLDAVLTVDNVSAGQRLTGNDIDLGGLSQVVATVIDDEAVLYGVAVEALQKCAEPAWLECETTFRWFSLNMRDRQSLR